MKNILPILFSLVFFIVKNSTSLIAQCNSIPAADICANAPDICDLNAYCGSTAGTYTSDYPTGMTCGYSIENNSYLKFTPVQSTVTLTVTVPNCSSILSGVQMVILQTSNCTNFTTISNCGAIALGATQTITATGLTVGQVYYIMIDGNAGAICDYVITAATGVGTCCPVVPNAGPDVEICKYDSTTITATGGISYLWTPGNFSTQIINVSPASTTVYTVSVSNGTCSVKDSMLLIVNPHPVVDAGVANPICLGDTLTLQPTVNSNLTLNSPLTFNNPIRYPINNLDTTFSTIQISGLNGTINSNSIVSVCFDITHANDADLDIFLFCPDGSSLELSTDNGGSSNNYTGTCFTSSATQQIISVLAPFTGSYIPEGAGGLAAFVGCSTNGIWKLGVYDDITGANVGSIDNFSLTINNPLPDPGITYFWSPASEISGVTILNADVYPANTKLYYLTATNAKNCYSIDSVNVIVNPLPLVNVGNDTAACSGTSFYLNGSGAVVYSWSPSIGLNDSTLQYPIATPSVSTTYILTGVNNTGCSKKDSVTITINNPPIVNAGTDATICIGDSVQLNTIGGTQFTWTPGIGLSNTSIADPIASPSISTTYTITSSNLGCTGTDSVTVTVGQINVNAGDDTTICKGASVQLNATGGTSYNWLPATGLSSYTISDPEASPIVTTTYIVTILSGQCSKNDTITIFVNQVPLINVSNDTTLCLGDSVGLVAMGAVSYSWSPLEGLSNAFISNPVAEPEYSNAYTVTGTDVNGCTSTETVAITINPLPTINAGNDVSICQGANVTLNATGGNSLIWSPSSSLSSAVIASPVASPTSTTNYIVTATSANGCSDTDTVAVTVNNSTLVIINTSVNVTCFGSNNGSASVLASGGSGVYNYSWFPGSYTVANATNLSAGTYTVTITDPNTSCTAISVISITQPADFVVAVSSTNSTCGNANGSATALITGTSTYSYSWNTSPIQNLPTAVNLAPGLYSVIITNSANCSKTEFVTITSIDNLIAAFTPSSITGEAPLNISFLNNSTGAILYSWSFGDTDVSNLTDPSHVYANSGIYTVQLVASNSTCLDTAEIIISVFDNLEYTLPNVFTPNGDMNNDVFTLNGSGMKTFKGQIFNRWGKILYEWNDPKDGWNGENQPDGVYYYKIEFNTNSGELKSLTGFINLLR
ncbi:MAG: hypothetical protein A3F72_16540 [Bacteroidetes bacterium RIFCSPLOWO2_12_FULL_35_15]|nr:MAG: hypothetical protein A3F72_16540 [Bacteroidetes bacterium RIFCSPLOWO2_12_FULL_35_15]